MKIKVTYIISDIDKALAFEWIATYLDKERFSLDFILLNPGPSDFEDYLHRNNIPSRTIQCQSKKDWPRCVIAVYKQLKRTRPDIVHCHLIQATIIGLTAAKLSRIPVRIYTRHHSAFHHVYFRKGVWWDKLANTLATDIVAISRPVQEILTDWEGVEHSKIRLIPHGFLLERFMHPDEATPVRLKEQYATEGFHPVVGVISRFTELKGIQYIIPAFEKILERYPRAKLLLFNAVGDYAAEIERLLARLPEGSYTKIAFEKDIHAAYQLFDVCIHTPVDAYAEAFGQVYIEALAAGVPLIATLSGIANDVLHHRKNAWVVPYRNAEEIFEGIVSITGNEQLRTAIIAAGRKTAKDFSLKPMIDQLSGLYQEASQKNKENRGTHIETTTCTRTILL